MSAVCGLRFTDLRRVAFSCKQRISFTITPKPRAQQQHSAVLGEGLGTRNRFAVHGSEPNSLLHVSADICMLDSLTGKECLSF